MMLQERRALFAVFGAEAFEDIAPHTLRLGSKCLSEGIAPVVGGNERIDGASLCSLGANLNRRHVTSRQRRLIGLHKVGRPRQTRQRKAFATAVAEKMPQLSMPVVETINVWQFDLGHRPHPIHSRQSPSPSPRR